MQFTRMSYSSISLNGPPTLVSSKSHSAMADLAMLVRTVTINYQYMQTHNGYDMWPLLLAVRTYILQHSVPNIAQAPAMQANRPTQPTPPTQPLCQLNYDSHLNHYSTQQPQQIQMQPTQPTHPTRPTEVPQPTQPHFWPGSSL